MGLVGDVSGDVEESGGVVAMKRRGGSLKERGEHERRFQAGFAIEYVGKSPALTVDITSLHILLALCIVIGTIL